MPPQIYRDEGASGSSHVDYLAGEHHVWVIGTKVDGAASLVGGMALPSDLLGVKVDGISMSGPCAPPPPETRQQHPGQGVGACRHQCTVHGLFARGILSLHCDAFSSGCGWGSAPLPDP